MSTATAETTWRADVDADGRIDAAVVQSYRDDGFVRIRGVFDPDEIAHFRTAAQSYLDANRSESLGAGMPARAAIFTQLVNVWRNDPAMAELTLHPRVAGIAEQLTDRPMRIWHDHMLVKEPRSNRATQFHQDRPYWPHDPASGPSLSAWIALVDVPAERGCMSFLPGTQQLTGFRPQNLDDEEDLFRVDPELRWSRRITLPLKAGDLTFHSSYTGHMAMPNTTDEARIAHVNIYMDADTAYVEQPHVVTDPLGLPGGARLDGELFPRPLG
ncbi:MAG: phytanoyl-CoA dioxygenase family protein [Mycobacteriales bacterium]